MGRAVAFGFWLAVFATVTAYGSTASPSRAHRKAAADRFAAHRAGPVRTHRSEAQAGSHAASSHEASAHSLSQRSRGRVHSGPRQTPEQVGRAAGLNIRRQMARSSRYRQSATTYRRSRPGYRSVRLRALRVAVRTPIAAERTEMVAADRPASASPDTQSDPQPAQPGSAGFAPDRSDGPAAAPGSAGSASAAPGEEESTSDLAPETAPQSGEASEEASLLIPRGAMPAPLRGSLASLERQNTKLDAEGLERIEDEDDLSARIAHGLLVPVPVSSGLSVNESLPANHRYCRPWTARFLADLARAHEAAFHHGFEVSSAVRTVQYQRRLMRINGNAAPAQGDIVSPHLTGATIDIAKQGMSRSELGWMRNHLLALEAAGKIDVEEEFRQSCFHITVYRNYDPARPAHRPSEARKPGSGPSELPVPQPDGRQPGEQPQPATGAASDSAATGI